MPPPAPPLPGSTLPLVLMTMPEAAPYAPAANIESDVNDTDINGARLMGRWLIDDRFTADLMVAWEEQETGGVSFGENIQPIPGFIPGTFLVPNTQNPLFSVAVPSTADYREFEFSDPVSSYHTDELLLANLVLNYEFKFRHADVVDVVLGTRGGT